MKVNEKVRQVRENKKLTQTYVAEQLGLPVQTYNSYELGRRRITAEFLGDVARVLDEPIENFF